VARVISAIMAAGFGGVVDNHVGDGRVDGVVGQ
jgi:hypothetical protein